MSRLTLRAIALSLTVFTSYATPDLADSHANPVELSSAQTSQTPGRQSIIRETPSGDLETLIFVPPEPTSPDASVAGDTGPKVRVFYPTGDQSVSGLCWESLIIDPSGNVYPLGSGRLYKIDPTGQIIDGVNDTNFFLTSDVDAISIVADATFTNVYMAGRNDAVLSGPFQKGTVLTNFVAGGGMAATNHIALGKGPLAGSLFVTDFRTGGIYRITIDPPSVSVFADAGELLQHPENLACAPDGTLYVATSLYPWRLIKVAPDATASVFNEGTVEGFSTARNMVAVSEEGIIFWSYTQGIMRFMPDGTRLRDLPALKDFGQLFNPFAGAFDSSGALYVVDNGQCKKIYRYRRPTK